MSGDRPNTNGSPDGPAQIGPYQILQVLGQGGMGVVYEARQRTPVHRRVALKIIKLGMDTNEVVARFEAERQALAVMDHPNIAHVFDGGSTETGRPYFVMELVKGTPITQYCDTHKLSTEARLTLFQQVCAAIQHAHQKGVIHRDLKPTNVLVTIQDDVPVPKVIDFGIAKAVGRDLTEKTLVTQLGAMIGTPNYMSPEQAEMSGLDVDTRTDIYSLGVMLYELLVGTLPYDLSDVPRGALFNVIREKDAPTPSSRLTTLRGDIQEVVARYRHTDLSTLRRALKGDLDWVVMKCLEKDRTRRYDTANGLAMELQRILRHEPVHARPPSTRYRVGKFVRRNKPAVAAATVTILAVVGGATAAIVGMVRAQRAEAVAGLEAETAQQVSNFLVGLFEVSDPSEARGNEISAREILDAGAVRIQSALGDQPLVQARLMTTMGRVHRGLGLFEESTNLLERALATRERELGPDHEDVALILTELAIVHHAAGQFERARERLERALGIYESRGPPEGTARVLSLLAGPDLETDFEKAVAMLDRALELAEGLPDSPLPHLNGQPPKSLLAEIHLNLGTALGNRTRVEAREQRTTDTWNARTEPNYRTALALQEDLYGPDDPRLVETLLRLARLYASQNEDMSRAGPLFERALDIRERTLGADHPELAAGLFEVATGYLNDPGYSYVGRDTLALPMLLRAREIQEGSSDGDHPQLARILTNLGVLYMRRGERDEAARLYEQALGMTERTEGLESRRASSIARNMASAFRTFGDLEGLDRFLRRQVTVREAEPGPSYRTQASRLAGFLRDQGRVRESDAAYASALTRLEEALGPSTPVWSLAFEWGELLQLEGRPRDAAPVLEHAVDLARAMNRPHLEARFGYPGDETLRGLQHLLAVRLDLDDRPAVDTLTRHMLVIPADTTPTLTDSGEQAALHRGAHPARLRDAGKALLDAGWPERGDQLFGRAIAIREWDDDARSREGWSQRARAVALHGTGIVYELWGRQTEARRIYSEAARMVEEHPADLGGDAAFLPTYLNFVSHAARLSIGQPLHVDGSELPAVWRTETPDLGAAAYAAADSAWRHAIAVYDSVDALGETTQSDRGSLSAMIADYAFMLREQGREADAVAVEDGAPDQCGVSYPKVWRGYELRRRGLLAKAETSLRQARDQLIKCGREPWNVAWADFGLAMTEQARGGAAEAEKRLRSAASVWEPAPPAQGNFATTLHALANLLRDQGRDEEAGATYERALSVFSIVRGQAPDFNWRLVPVRDRRAACQADYAAMVADRSG